MAIKNETLKEFITKHEFDIVWLSEIKKVLVKSTIYKPSTPTYP